MLCKIGQPFRLAQTGQEDCPKSTCTAIRFIRTKRTPTVQFRVAVSIGARGNPNCCPETGLYRLMPGHRMARKGEVSRDLVGIPSPEGFPLLGPCVYRYSVTVQTA